MNLTTPETRDFAKRLLAQEAAIGKETDSQAVAVVRVCEKLRCSLTAMAGLDGFRALLSRALTLAKAEFPALWAVSVNRDGSIENLDGVSGASSGVEPDSKHAVADGGVILIAQLLGLLVLFIGEGLTVQLMEDLWPAAGFDGIGSGKES